MTSGPPCPDSTESDGGAGIPRRSECLAERRARGREYVQAFVIEPRPRPGSAVEDDVPSRRHLDVEAVVVRIYPTDRVAEHAVTEDLVGWVVTMTRKPQACRSPLSETSAARTGYPSANGANQGLVGSSSNAPRMRASLRGSVGQQHPWTWSRLRISETAMSTPATRTISPSRYCMI